MTDFDVNTDLRPETPFASDEELSPARDLLMAEIAAERALLGYQTAAGRGRPSAALLGARPGLRLALAGAVSAVAAAAMAVAMFASPAAAPERALLPPVMHRSGTPASP